MAEPNPLPPSLRGKGGKARLIAPRFGEGSSIRRAASMTRHRATSCPLPSAPHAHDAHDAPHADSPAHHAPHAPRNILHTSFPRLSPRNPPAAQPPCPVPAQHLARSLPRTMRTMRTMRLMPLAPRITRRTPCATSSTSRFRGFPRETPTCATSVPRSRATTCPLPSTHDAHDAHDAPHADRRRPIADCLPIHPYPSTTANRAPIPVVKKNG
jgi:hypothetical protein